MKRLTRAQAIKKYCKESCCASDYHSWADCTVLNCPLWRYRKGNEQNCPKNNNLLINDRKSGTFTENKGILEQGVRE
jgi:hypothetical protein